MCTVISINTHHYMLMQKLSHFWNIHLPFHIAWLSHDYSWNRFKCHVALFNTQTTVNYYTIYPKLTYYCMPTIILKKKKKKWFLGTLKLVSTFNPLFDAFQKKTQITTSSWVFWKLICQKMTWLLARLITNNMCGWPSNVKACP